MDHGLRNAATTTAADLAQSELLSGWYAEEINGNSSGLYSVQFPAGVHAILLTG
jgi:hypothetical protein